MLHYPLVSVCIPVYNPGSFLKDAVNSVLAQSFTDFELLIIDDASTQPVEAIVTRYRDPRIRFERNPQNLGLVGNWNRCIELAQGEFITIFHQDDLMRSDNLKAKAALLGSHLSMGLVHSDIDTIDAIGAVTGGHWARQPNDALVTSGWQCFEQLAVRGNFISCPSVVVRAECYRVLGGFDSRLPFTCDLEMWMRIASRYDVGYLATPLIANRVHTRQETQRFSGAGREIREVRRALDIVFTEYAPVEVSAALRSTAYHNLITWAYHMGRWKLGQRQWRSSFGYLRLSGEMYLKTLF